MARLPPPVTGRARTTDLAPAPAGVLPLPAALMVPPGGTAPIHATQISATRQRLPNGNLLCIGVPVARTGLLTYGPGEVPVRPGPDGLIHIERTADALFAPMTLGSINAAAVTDGHPLDDVTPDNWRQLARGFGLNTRRGTGADHDVALTDVLVTEAGLIRDIEAGLVEISLGYDADYRDLGGGRGQQHNIVVNHIAFVPRGRCGPRCAVGDEAFQPPATATKKDRHMATKTKTPAATRRTLDKAALIEAARLRVAEAAAEVAALAAQPDDEEEEERSDGAIHIHLGSPAPAAQAARTADAAPAAAAGTPDARMAAIEATQERILTLLEGRPAPTKDAAAAAEAGKEKPAAKTEDKSYEDDDESDEAEAWRKERDAKTKDAEAAPAKTGDSAALATAYTNMLAQAEVLVPGFKVPTFDSALVRHKTVDRMCATRRKVLDQLYATAEGKLLVDTVVGAGKTYDGLGMECGAVATVFKQAAAAKALHNNATATRDSRTLPAAADLNPGAGAPPKRLTAAEINARNAEFWKGK